VAIVLIKIRMVPPLEEGLMFGKEVGESQKKLLKTLGGYSPDKDQDGPTSGRGIKCSVRRLEKVRRNY